MAASQDVLKAGFLTKQGGSIKSWKRRWFVLKNCTDTQPFQLEYFKTEKLSHTECPLGTIFFKDCKQITKLEESAGSKKFSFEIVTPSRAYQIYADSSEDFNDWVDLLNKSLPCQEKNTENNSSSDEPVQGYQGFLRKKKIKDGGKASGWKHRYLILRSQTLSWFKNENTSQPLGALSLPNCIGVAILERKTDGQHCFEVALRDYTYIFAAESSEELEAWVDNLTKALEKAKSIVNRVTLKTVDDDINTKENVSPVSDEDAVVETNQYDELHQEEASTSDVAAFDNDDKDDDVSECSKVDSDTASVTTATIEISNVCEDSNPIDTISSEITSNEKCTEDDEPVHGETVDEPTNEEQPASFDEIDHLLNSISFATGGNSSIPEVAPALPARSSRGTHGISNKSENTKSIGTTIGDWNRILKDSTLKNANEYMDTHI